MLLPDPDSPFKRVCCPGFASNEKFVTIRSFSKLNVTLLKDMLGDAANVLPIFSVKKEVVRRLFELAAGVAFAADL